LVYIFAGNGMGIYIQVVAVGSKIRIFAAIGYVSPVQDHPRSMFLVPIERACDLPSISPSY